jgi:hypothetical protein
VHSYGIAICRSAPAPPVPAIIVEPSFTFVWQHIVHCVWHTIVVLQCQAVARQINGYTNNWISPHRRLGVGQRRCSPARRPIISILLTGIDGKLCGDRLPVQWHSIRHLRQHSRFWQGFDGRRGCDCDLINAAVQTGSFALNRRGECCKAALAPLLLLLHLLLCLSHFGQYVAHSSSESVLQV